MNAPAEQSREYLLALVAEQAAQIATLHTLILEQADALKAAQQEIASLKEEIARLKTGDPDAKTPALVPEWVQANTPPPPAPAPRKKRAHGFTHHRLPPTREIVHAHEKRPDCGMRLCGGWERSRRQVVDVPLVPVEVTDPILVSRYCGRCHKTHTPAPDLSDVVTGQQTFGHNLVSLVAYLDTVGRVPVRTIARLLEALWGLRVSAGQLVEMPRRVARQGKAT